MAANVNIILLRLQQTYLLSDMVNLSHDMIQCITLKRLIFAVAELIDNLMPHYIASGIATLSCRDGNTTTTHVIQCVPKKSYPFERSNLNVLNP